MSASPEDGDIVVRQDKHENRHVYVLQTTPGPAQLRVQSRDEAIAQAVTFARRQQVRVWIAVDGDHDFMLLQDFRIADAEEV